jgi:hypothetical protein
MGALRGRRLLMGAEAAALERGGFRLVARAAGVRELSNQRRRVHSQVRSPYPGR